MSSRSSKQKLSTEIAKYLSIKNKASIDAKLQEGREFAKAAAEASHIGGKFGCSKFQVLTDTAGSSLTSDKDDIETAERQIFVKVKNPHQDQYLMTVMRRRVLRESNMQMKL